jgi:O-antigen/teichoic acid export membrane protein
MQHKFSLKNILYILEFDKTVFYSLFSKIWSILSGSLTVSLVVYFFTKSQQGFYYTFASLLALQTFVEMGLGFVIQQFSSHEWSNLNFEKNIGVVGNIESISRLTSIARISIIWYAFAGILAFIILATFGTYFFYNSTHNFEIWFWPWIFLCVFSSLNLILTPVWSMLEGCNQVQKLYGFRFLQSVISNILVWIAIVYGLNLWAIVFSSIASLFVSIVFINRDYKLFIKDLFLKKPKGSVINWKRDMLQMQWRVAVSWLSGYFAFNLFTPMLFKFQGPEIAGQFGMSWSIISIICNLGLSWVNPKIPPLAILVSEKNYKELDTKFYKLIKIMSFITISISIIFLTIVLNTRYININFLTKTVNRLLPFNSLLILVLAQFFNIISNPFSIYMRMHKKEPVMFLSILQSVLITISVYFTCKYYTINLMSISFLFINVIILLLIIKKWKKFKMEVQSLILNIS